MGATNHLFFARLNHSLIGESKQQQLAWLADRVTGDSPAIQEARELLRLAIIKQADSVLLMGETRTGKGVCALAIHEGSGARGRFGEHKKVGGMSVLGRPKKTGGGLGKVL